MLLKLCALMELLTMALDCRQFDEYEMADIILVRCSLETKT